MSERCKTCHRAECLREETEELLLATKARHGSFKIVTLLRSARDQAVQDCEEAARRVATSPAIIPAGAARDMLYRAGFNANIAGVEAALLELIAARDALKQAHQQVKSLNEGNIALKQEGDNLRRDLKNARNEVRRFGEEVDRQDRVIADLQKHAQRPVEWQRTLDDVLRLASLYTHDMALPTSTEGEKALGRAVEWLVAVTREGSEIIEALANYQVINSFGGRVIGFEGWAASWRERHLVPTSAGLPSPSPIKAAEAVTEPVPVAPIAEPIGPGCLGPRWP